MQERSCLATFCQTGILVMTNDAMMIDDDEGEEGEED